MQWIRVRAICSVNRSWLLNILKYKGLINGVIYQPFLLFIGSRNCIKYSYVDDHLCHALRLAEIREVTTLNYFTGSISLGCHFLVKNDSSGL